MTSQLRVADAGQSHDRFWAAVDEDAFAGSTISMAVVTENQAVSDANAGEIEITAGQKMISATSGSLLTSLLVTPLDVVRVRLQSQAVTKPPKIDFSKLAITSNTLRSLEPASLGVTSCCREVFFSNNADACIVPRPTAAAGLSTATVARTPPIECAVEEAQRRTISSTMDGFKKIARNEGVTTLWRGLSPTLLMAIPANIIYFTGYDWLRYNHKSPVAGLPLRDDYIPLVAGASARMLAAAAVSPVELFRTRLQATSGRSATPGEHVLETFRGVREMVATQGYRALWRGVTLTLWRDVPFSAIYWWGYETIRGKLTDMRDERAGRAFDREAERMGQHGEHQTLRRRRRSQSRDNHRDTFADSFVAGATSGAAASVLTMPFDVGKTRTQVYKDVAGAPAHAAAPEERSMTRLLWHIFKSEGAAGLWKGWIPRTLKVAPACAIMISSYEVSKRVFRGVNERKVNGGM